MINDKTIEKEIVRLGNLKQYKNKSEDELKKLAISSLQKKEFDISNRFTDSEEKKSAKKLFDKYLDFYKFDDFTEIEKLGDLVYAKILKNRLEARFNELSKEDITPHKDLTAQYTSLLKEISNMEKELGLFKQDKSEDELTALQKLRKKFDAHINFNKNEFTLACNHCGKFNLIRKIIKDFKILKHPFFSGRWYYNYRGIELVKKGIWTKEQYAYVFFTTPKYVEYCLEHENDIIDIEGIETQDLETYIKNCDYLPDVEIKDHKIVKSEKQLNKFEE